IQAPDGWVAAGQILSGTSEPFTNDSLNRSGIIGLTGGFTAAGRISWDGAGNLSLATDEDSHGTLSSHSYTGTYSVAPNGRVTMNTSEQFPSLVLYLTDINQGFIIGELGNPIIVSGLLEPQLGISFSAASFSGKYFGVTNSPDLFALLQAH